LDQKQNGLILKKGKKGRGKPGKGVGKEGIRAYKGGYTNNGNGGNPWGRLGKKKKQEGFCAQKRLRRSLNDYQKGASSKELMFIKQTYHP